MFSRRTAWSREENPLAERTRAARARGELIDLTQSNPTLVNLPYAKELRGFLTKPEAAVYRPHPFGALEARNAISAYYARRNIPIAPEQILLTASTSEAYTFAFRLLADVHDEVLAPTPSYPLFSYLADVADVRLKAYHLEFDGNRWNIDFGGFTRAAERIKVALLVCPNNPTGSYPSLEERQRLLDLARTRNLALVSDEVFLDYLADHAKVADVTFAGWQGPLALSLSGLSKVAGLPQMKLSWIVISGDQHLVEEARARLEIMGDTFLSVSTPIQAALPEILAMADDWQPQLKARIAKNLETLRSATAGTRMRTRPLQGGWYAIVDVDHDSLDDEGMALQLLESASVLVHPGYLYDLGSERALVVSLIPSDEVFSEGVRRIRAEFG